MLSIRLQPLSKKDRIKQSAITLRIPDFIVSRLHWEHYITVQKRKQEKRGCFSASSFIFGKLAFVAHLSEALAAENRTIGLGLEGNLSLATATSAGSSEELTGTTGSILASVTAALAALGLVLEATLSVESLLTSGEHELIAALFANQILIFVHCFYLSSVRCPVNATGKIVGTRSLLNFCGEPRLNYII